MPASHGSMTALTTLQFTAATDIAETTTFDSGGVLERIYGLEARHNFTTYLVGIAGLGFMTRDFSGVDITESQVTAAVGSEYYLNRVGRAVLTLSARRCSKARSRSAATPSMRFRPACGCATSRAAGPYTSLAMPALRADARSLRSRP